MKRTALITAALVWLSSSPSGAQEAATAAGATVPGVTVGDFRMEHGGRYMSVDMGLGLGGLDVSSNRAVLLTPRLVNGGDSLDLAPVGVYGRRRYYYYVRNGEGILGAGGMNYRASRMPDSVAYHAVVEYEDWMNGAVLALHREDYGCCGTLLSEDCGLLGRYDEGFFPELVYMRPAGEAEKVASLEGSAYIDFPVDRTEIHPDYRRNAAELGRIRATIDSVSGDRDITITSLRLKGFASPEGSYAHNRGLAMGRTQALKGYILGMYRFDGGIISTAHEPEDWDGLRRLVERGGLEHRTEILALIDSDMEPDAKEARIKREYPEDYRFMLREYYPALRHTDYRIAYTIRSYTDVDEIREVMRTQPQKLSLNEFYLISQEYEPGTPEFTEVFETAVRMYPDDGAANLNAANAAMRSGDLDKAERYLAKAGSSPEATYARAALAIRGKDYATARTYLMEAAAQGLPQAEKTLAELDRGRR